MKALITTGYILVGAYIVLVSILRYNQYQDLMALCDKVNTKREVKAVVNNDTIVFLQVFSPHVYSRYNTFGWYDYNYTEKLNEKKREQTKKSL